MQWWFRGLLQASYSSERGAALAYGGHAATLTGAERVAVLRVQAEEHAHRARLAEILRAEGVWVNPLFELFFWTVGTCVALGCRVWGPWASSLGASWFELHGVLDYQALERAAIALEKHEWLTDFREMAAVEEQHRELFLAMANGRPLPESFRV